MQGFSAIIIYAIFLAPFAFSIYIITQTSAKGVQKAVGSDRTKAIFVGFVPCLGFALALQLYWFFKFQSAKSAHIELSSAPTSFGSSGSRSMSPKPPPEQPPSAPPQQGNNPFL